MLFKTIRTATGSIGTLKPLKKTDIKNPFFKLLILVALSADIK